LRNVITENIVVKTTPKQSILSGTLHQNWHCE